MSLSSQIVYFAELFTTRALLSLHYFMSKEVFEKQPIKH